MPFTWTNYFATERISFQRDIRKIISILHARDAPMHQLRLCYNIAASSGYSGDATILLSAVRHAEGRKERHAQRHLTGNIKSLTEMFIDFPKEGRSKCFRSRLLVILHYCQRLADQLEDGNDPLRGERVASALEWVILQLGVLTLDGVPEVGEKAEKARRAVGEKERELKCQSLKKRDSGGEEAWLVWNALQFRGLGKGGCSCVACVELQAKGR